MVAAIGLVAGLGFALLAPPFAGYDETIHFVRAYQVSQGGLLATQRGERVGGSMPDALRTDIGRLLRDGLYEKRDRTAFLDHLGDRPARGKEVFLDFPSAAVYSPVSYAPAAVFIGIGRALGLSTLALLYLGRIGSLLATIALLSLAVRRMPTRAWMLAAVALLPVTVFQAATVSADGITIALALLAVALALDVAATPRGEVTKRRLIEIALTVVALGLAKPPYVLFALAFVIPIHRHGGRIARPLGAALGAGFAATAAWGLYASRVYVAPELPPGYAGPLNRFTVYTHVDQRRQRNYVLHHPFGFLRAIGRTLSTYWTDLLHQSVAQVPLWSVPVGIVIAGFGIVAASAAIPEVGSRSLLGRRSRAVLIGIAIATFLSLMLLAYLGWNALESPRIEAFQGRYLLPLVPLLLVALPSPKSATAAAQRFGTFVAIASGLLLAVTWFGLRSHFY
jgi:uncharacterized membrane protein